MKKIATNLSILLLVLTLGCNDFKSNYGYSPFVQTTASTLSKPESGATAVVTIQYVGPKLDQDITVTYQITQSAGPASGVTLPGTSVTIPAGSYSATTTISFTNDVVQNPNRVITVQLLSTSVPTIPVATPLTTRDKTVITIVDDDCPYLEADYNGKTAKAQEVYGPGSCYPSCTTFYDVVLTKTGTNTYTTDNFWDSGWAINIIVDPATLNVTIPSQSPAAGVTVSGSGTLATCPKLLSFTTLVNGSPNINNYQF